ncbi:hypothetical protein SynMVIR181_01118 [Synechococcus sp. MVIR-18-1]|nr:hypothetical protein SynMVIR181_01118 [Synechococcus sp. MVIR-18-1]
MMTQRSSGAASVQGVAFLLPSVVGQSNCPANASSATSFCA